MQLKEKIVNVILSLTFFFLSWHLLQMQEANTMICDGTKFPEVSGQKTWILILS